jgi:hypothetical protein
MTDQKTDREILIDTIIKSYDLTGIKGVSEEEMVDLTIGTLINFCTLELRRAVRYLGDKSLFRDFSPLLRNLYEVRIRNNVLAGKD